MTVARERVKKSNRIINAEGCDIILIGHIYGIENMGLDLKASVARALNRMNTSTCRILCDQRVRLEERSYVAFDEAQILLNVQQSHEKLLSQYESLLIKGRPLLSLCLKAWKDLRCLPPRAFEIHSDSAKLG